MLAESCNRKETRPRSLQLLLTWPGHTSSLAVTKSAPEIDILPCCWLMWSTAAAVRVLSTIFRLTLSVNGANNLLAAYETTAKCSVTDQYDFRMSWPLSVLDPSSFQCHLKDTHNTFNLFRKTLCCFQKYFI